MKNTPPPAATLSPRPVRPSAPGSVLRVGDHGPGERTGITQDTGELPKLVHRQGLPSTTTEGVRTGSGAGEEPHLDGTGNVVPETGHRVCPSTGAVDSPGGDGKVPVCQGPHTGHIPVAVAREGSAVVSTRSEWVQESYVLTGRHTGRSHCPTPESPTTRGLGSGSRGAPTPGREPRVQVPGCVQGRRPA